jgi:hypothetical protein
VAFNAIISSPIKCHPIVSKFTAAEEVHGYMDAIKLFNFSK